MHWLPEKTDYRCFFKGARPGSAATTAPGPSPRGPPSASGSGFEVASSVTAPPAPSNGQGVEVELEVAFEPTVIGESLRDVLVVASAVGGEYQCPLVGRCVPPKPQGPVDISKVSWAAPPRCLIASIPLLWQLLDSVAAG